MLERDRLSGVDPSPQFTAIPVNGARLETLNVTVTVALVNTGLGVRLMIVRFGTDGGRILTEPVPLPVEPLLSFAVTVMVNVPAELYEWLSDVAIPGMPVSVLPSPQLTE
jgi:hypothetical protein